MGELAAASKAPVMVSYWWSRGDNLANHKLGQIHTRATGVVEVDTDSKAVDRGSRSPIPRCWQSWTSGGRWSKPAGRQQHPEPGTGPGEVCSESYPPARRRHSDAGGAR